MYQFLHMFGFHLESNQCSKKYHNNLGNFSKWYYPSSWKMTFYLSNKSMFLIDLLKRKEVRGKI